MNATILILAQRNPWDDYGNPGKGGGKGPPAVPEPAETGALILLVGIVLILVVKRLLKKKIDERAEL